MQAILWNKDWRTTVLQAFVLPAQVLLLNVSISDPVVSLQPSATGTLPAHAVAVPCAVAVYALKWVGESTLITSNVAPIKSANSFWMSLKLMLHLFRFDPEQQRLFETKEHHRFAEKLCLAKYVQEGSTFWFFYWWTGSWGKNDW